MNKKLNHYWLGMLAGAVITAGSLFFFSGNIDPYHFFGRGDIESKPAIHGNLRFHKSYQVRSVRPSVLILGSSRAYHGLDPDTPALKGAGPVYNMGMPACRISEIAALLEHANNVEKIDMAIVGLDFFAFDSVRTSVTGMPWDSLYTDSTDPSLASFLMDALKSSASTKAVVDSMTTIIGDHRSWDFYHENGFLVQDYNDEKVNHVGGYYQTISYFIDSGVPDNKDEFANYIMSGSTLDGPLDDYRKIIEYAIAHGITLKLFISPVHAVQMEYMNQIAYINIYDEWRKRLINIVEEFAGEGGDVALWDFSGYNSITTEAIPGKKDKDGHMIYFLDASHYKGVTGDLIMAKMLGVNYRMNNAHKDFGKVINSKNFSDHLKQERNARIEFFENNSGQYVTYKSLLAT